MAASVLLPYQTPSFNDHSMTQQYAHFGAFHHGATTISPASSPVASAFPKYEAQSSAARGTSTYQRQLTASAIAAQAASDNSDKSRSTLRKDRTKRRSWSRGADAPVETSDDAAITSGSRAAAKTAAKEKFKSNMKKVGKAKGDPSTTLDLSLTAAENERRTGIPIATPNMRARAVTDVPFVSVSKKRNNTFGFGTTPSSSFRPTSPFVPLHSGSRPQTPHSAYHSHANSTVTSEHTNDYWDIARQTSATTSSRPSLHLNTYNEADSIRSAARRRRNTNQSTASTTTPTNTSRPRKSLDKAFSIMTRRDSSATQSTMDPATRAASIRAARQAFEEREQEKDEKYERRAAKAQEKQEMKQRRKNSSAAQTARSRAGSNAPKNASNLHLSEKADYHVGSRPYDALPIPKAERLPTHGHGSSTPNPSEMPKFTRKRKAKNRYAQFLSWLKTKFLNIGRRRAARKGR